MDTTQLNAIMLKFMVLTSGLIGSSAKLRITPNNTAGVVDTSVVLHCQGSVDVPFGGVIWNEFISSTTSPSSLTLNSDLAPNAPNPQLYTITGDSSVAQYHLNIELAFLSGGRYQCLEPIDGFFGLAHVTVLESAPVCNDPVQTDGVVEEGETITYTCEVAYNSTSIDWPPVMTWTGPDGTIAGVKKLSTSGGTVTSSVNVTGAPGLNGTVYSVRTNFEAYGGSLPAEHASNVPTYSHSHSFSILEIQYGPVNIMISSEQDCYTPGTSLICSAEGNPPPSYQWRNLQDNSTTDGPILTLNEKMLKIMKEFRCEAYNTIRGTNRSTTKDLTFTVTDSCAGDLTAGEIVGICVGVIAGLCMIIAVIIVVKVQRWTTFPHEFWNAMVLLLLVCKYISCNYIELKITGDHYTKNASVLNSFVILH